MTKREPRHASARISLGVSLHALGLALTAASALTVSEARAQTCTPTGAHGKHLERNIACATCHPCGTGIQIGTVVYPRLTSSAGSIVDRSSGTARCWTGCHAPMGATVAWVSWNAGPLACTTCHNNVGLAAGEVIVSAHPGFGLGGSCTTCHVTSAHTSGDVFLAGGGDCQSCHSGHGTAFMGETPPLLLGWTGTTGDFHGEPSGSGFGGTLLPPYGRHEPAIRCTACHDPHVSANPFLFAKVVNGVPIGPGAITPAGVGAERLCESCHDGDRHARCAECHVTDPRPAGAACLSCHGHEGTTWFPWPGGSPADYHDQSQNSSCAHCHESWAAPIETTPPVILYPGNEQITVIVSGDQATISWLTDEGATSFVEYGTGDLGFVAGDAVITTYHSVQLTGLQSNTVYFFRVSSSDVMRNVTVSEIRSFTTFCTTCPPTPLPVANASFESPVTATTEQSGAWWKEPWQADYCGTYPSNEMTGSNVFRIAATPREYFDDESQEFYEESGYGTARYALSRADLDAGNTITFDVRPKFLGAGSTVSLVLLAFDASGALITDTATNRYVFDIIGATSPTASSSLRIAAPAVNTTYTRTLAVNATVANGLVAGKSWADVAKLHLVLYVTSGSQVDVYFDNFR